MKAVMANDLEKLGIRTQSQLARAMYAGLIDVLKRRVWIQRLPGHQGGKPYVERPVLFEMMNASLIEPNLVTNLWELSPLGREIFEHEEDWLAAAERADASSATE